MIDERNPEQIKADILVRIVSKMDTREGSFANDILGPTALEIWKARQSFLGVEGMIFPDENSGGVIDKACAEVGIVRKGGKKATASMNFTGTDDTAIPKGKVFVSKSGLEFIMQSNAVIKGGAAQGVAEAAEIGNAYNVDVGEIERQYENIPGLASVVSGAATGGVGEETDAALAQRLDEYRKNPATSGNVNHYKLWAKEVDGVGDAKIAPTEKGAGTVGVLIVSENMEPAESAVVAACAAHIEELRPIGASVTVESATALEINVAASIQIEPSITLAQVKSVFTQKLDEHLKSVAFKRYELLYNRIAFMLLDIDGVIDYSSLTVNAKTENIQIGAKQVPILESVVIK